MSVAEPEEVAPQIIHPATTITQFDLATIINAICQQNIEPTRARRVPKRIFNKLRPLLKGKGRMDYEEQDVYIEILIDILQAQQIVQRVPPLVPTGKDTYDLGEKLAWWQGMDVVQQTCYLIGLWCTLRAWPDLAGVNFDPWDFYGWNHVMGRDKLLECLRAYTPERWYSISSLLDELWQQYPFAIRPKSVQTYNQKKNEALHKNWLTCEGEIYTGMLSSTLHELGLISIGYFNEKDTKRSHNPDAFQITAFGANIFSLIQKPTTSYVPSENNHRTLIVQPNFELLLLEPDFPTLYKILPFAQVQQIDVASRLTLTRASVQRAIDRGIKINDILATLEENSQKELPQNVVYTLKDWVKDYKEVLISQVYLLEVDSEEVADSICHASKLNKQFSDEELRKIAPCIIAVDSSINLLSLKRLLEKEGVAARVSNNLIQRLNSHGSIYGISR
ncbi:hypothetical protein KSF_031260 [Reticulibacter mediterranei]|uniref:Helicase XPB/Ssl2 N-terminal domain-containing protein n=1 Tax=Reticulibacter mediterranei TaxID=2778369 RepID=A0A8J3IGD4_9CHLR|nr:helicase-associated domain-containing protein [Reticulibacter mediterranei]GHO93078.1 hypothetical protein KSF_031260 [Reticulibacter mediterranei]